MQVHYNFSGHSNHKGCGCEGRKGNYIVVNREKEISPQLKAVIIAFSVLLTKLDNDSSVTDQDYASLMAIINQITCV